MSSHRVLIWLVLRAALVWGVVIFVCFILFLCIPKLSLYTFGLYPTSYSNYPLSPVLKNLSFLNTLSLLIFIYYLSLACGLFAFYFLNPTLI